MKRYGLVRFGLFLGLVLGACGGGRSDIAGAPRTLWFAIIPKSLDLPVFNYARIGAERKAKELGDVEVIWRGPVNADQVRQKEIVEVYDIKEDPVRCAELIATAPTGIRTSAPGSRSAAGRCSRRTRWRLSIRRRRR